MRLREREKREIVIYPWLNAEEDAYTWGEPFAVRAAVYPLGQKLQNAVYGEQVTDKRLMLYDGKEPLQVGMGVSLDGGAPAFRIVSMETWRHVSAVLERIPEGRRG